MAGQEQRLPVDYWKPTGWMTGERHHTVVREQPAITRLGTMPIASFALFILFVTGQNHRRDANVGGMRTQMKKYEQKPF